MDYVYGVLTNPSREEEELVVLPEDSAYELAEIRDILRCKTWENCAPRPLRRDTGSCWPGVATRNSPNCLPNWTLAAESAERSRWLWPSLTPTRSRPETVEPFHAHELAVDPAEDYPPDPHYLQNLLVSPEVVDRWGERYETSHHRPCVMLRASNVSDVITSLEAEGHRCREDSDLIRAGIAE